MIDYLRRYEARYGFPVECPKAVGRTARELVPQILAALDRMAASIHAGALH